ncbi:hypothetical protein Q3O98_22645 [Ralstonia pseudosolanacearum]|nr:hypothetical protein [Ralstonia pseudosolanacearum]
MGRDKEIQMMDFFGKSTSSVVPHLGANAQAAPCRPNTLAVDRYHAKDIISAGVRMRRRRRYRD